MLLGRFALRGFDSESSKARLEDPEFAELGVEARKDKGFEGMTPPAGEANVSWEVADVP
jgi:hypothetical protein